MTERVEEWRNVPGMEDRLMVSSKGNVWRKWRPREGSHGPIPRPGLAKLTTKKSSGHQYIFARCPDGVKRRFYVHRMMAEAFIPRVNANNEVCHINDIPSDNRLENIYWGTKKTNADDLVRNGKHYWASRDACSRGHKYTPENTRYFTTTKGGKARECVACRKERRRKANDK